MSTGPDLVPPQVAAGASDAIVSLCVVIENDAAILPEFFREAIAALSQFRRYYELVVVDNHSTDETISVIQSAMQELPSIRWIRLSRTYKREVAFSAALDHCVGDYVVALNPRRDPVRLVNEVTARITSGVDVVVGQARLQKRSWMRRQLSALSRKLAGYALRAQIDRDTGSCFGFSRRALNAITRLKSKSRFILYDSRVVGYRRVLFEYDPAVRPGARTDEESWIDAFVGRMQMVVANSLLPLRLATFLGLCASVLNLLYLGYILAVVFFKQQVAEGWLTTSLTHTVMFLFLFVILSILAEYIGQILQESKDQPLYFVEQENASAVSSYDRTRLNVV